MTFFPLASLNENIAIRLALFSNIVSSFAAIYKLFLYVIVGEMASRSSALILSSDDPLWDPEETLQQVRKSAMNGDKQQERRRVCGS